MSERKRLAAEALERLQKTTEGKWEPWQTDVRCLYHNPLTDEEEVTHIAEWVSPSNGEFISWCHENVPALASALLQAEEELEHFRATIREAESLMHEQKREVERLREALQTVEPHLSLLRHRGGCKFGGTGGAAEVWEVDEAIGKARRVLGW